MPGVDTDGLAAVYTADNGGPGVSSYMDYEDFRGQSDAFVELAAFKPRRVDLAGGGVTERIEGMLVSASYFHVLGIEPAAGRFFLPEEDRVPGAHAVAVISHALWQGRFGGDPDVVGRTVALNGRDFAVVGVAPPGFHGTRLLDRPRVFVPMMMQPHLMPANGNLLDNRGWSGVLVVGRLAPGVSPARAEASLAPLIFGFGVVGLDYFRTLGIPIVAGRGFTAADRAAGSLTVLRAAVASIDPDLPLVDVGTLEDHLSGLLSRERLTTTLLGLSAVLALVLAAVGLYGVVAYAVSRRTRELGLRTALGARRGDLLALVLNRGMALAFAGLAVGLAAAFGGTRLLEGFLYGTSRTDPFTFVVVSGLLLAVALVASYLPARAATRVDPLQALRHE